MNADAYSMNGFRVIRKYNADDWDSIVSKAPNIFITSHWLESFRSVTRQPVYFKFFRNDALIGLIAGIEVRSPSLLNSLLGKELFFFTGPATLMADMEIRQLCMNSLLHYCSRKNYTHLKLLSMDYPYLYDCDTSVFRPKLRREFVINLNKTMLEIERRIDKDQRRHVRKARSQGWTFEIYSSRDAVESLIQLLEETRLVRTKKKYSDYNYYYIPYFDKDVICSLLERNIAVISCAVKDGIVHHAELTAIYSNRAYGLLAGADSTAYREHAGPFLMYKVMEYLHSKGVASYNLGGGLRDLSSENLIRFKMSFGAEEFRGTGGSTVPLDAAGFTRMLRTALRKYRIARRKIRNVTAVT
jgi:hypothetical protein